MKQVIKHNPKIITINGLTQNILDSKIIIYPTDTLFAIGCNAKKDDLVLEIFKIKKRQFNKPMSVIAPSFDWIFQNCKTNENQRNIIKKYLPGPYTIILEKKEKSFLRVATAYKNTIGIRLLDTKIQKKIKKTNIAFITTSANISRDEKILRNLNHLKIE
ncbi:MAG: hypothetical protein B6U87_00485, partial [Candidatus Aenigmarchaeota archaeon ex4484_52]